MFICPLPFDGEVGKFLEGAYGEETKKRVVILGNSAAGLSALEAFRREITIQKYCWLTRNRS